MTARNILLLGGTTEASALATALAARGERATLSYAGRVASPKPQPLPVRTGGFGGPEGLARFLLTEGITHLVDATHPFAATMSGNAVAAAAAAGIPLAALVRPAWVAGPGDRWQEVPDLAGAVAALDPPARRVFLALGRQSLDAFAARPQHHYLLRLVDPPEGPLPLRRAEVVVARGPFDTAGDTALMTAHGIEIVVAKNAGGTGAAAKLAAARSLGLPVVMIARPMVPARTELASVGEVLDWLGHGVERGV